MPVPYHFLPSSLPPAHLKSCVHNMAHIFGFIGKVELMFLGILGSISAGLEGVFKLSIAHEGHVLQN